MSKHYLFMLHGMGEQTPGWSKEHKKIIEDKAKEYSGETKTNLRKRVEIVELEFGSLLDGIMQDLLAGGDSLGPANDWLKGTDGNGLAKFIRNCALDVTAYIWHVDTSIFVLNRIAEKMLSVIQPHPITNQFSLLCHSLGTKVGFDLLHLLYIEDTNGGGDTGDLDALSPLFKLRPTGDPESTSPKFSNLYLVANVMPLLNDVDLQTFSSDNTHVQIRINTIPYQGGVVLDDFRIFNNHYDPFARLGRTHHVPAKCYTEEIRLQQAHEWNMHSLEHYLAHPKVHIPIIEGLYKITVPEKQKKIQEYAEAHHDAAKESALEAALSVTPQFTGTDAKSLADHLKALAAVLP